MSPEDRIEAAMRRVDPAWGEPRVEALLSRLHRRSRRRAVKRRTVLGAAVLAAAAAVALFQTRPSPPVAPKPVAAVQAPEPPAELTLADGSVLRRSGSADVVVHEVSAKKVRVGLESGRVSVEVTPRPEREFVVDAGRFLALVLGTSFDVNRQGDGVEVSVRHGHVRVMRDDGALMGDLYAGQSRLFGEASTPLAPPSPASTEPVLVEPSPSVTAAPAPKARADWRPHAREGGYDEAYALIRGGGAVRDTVDDLLLAADAARLSGHPAEALPFLDKVLLRHASDGRSSMAAFTRGRILLGMGQAANAGASFERALELGASGSLAENALARAVEAHGRSGTGKARSLAERYVERYPNGRWLGAVKRNGGLE